MVSGPWSPELSESRLASWSDLGAGDEFYRDVLNNLYDGVYFVDRGRRVIFWNRGAERITGFTAAEILGNRCMDNILMHVNEQGTNLCEGLCPVAATLADGQSRELEVYLHHKKGHRVPVLVQISPILESDGAVSGVVQVFSDNSSKIAAVERINELERVAFLDALTEVGNRRYTEMNIRAKLDEVRRYGWVFGLLFVDIDHFKAINDKYGHDTGDEVLKMVARTIVGSLRPFDFLGRWGGEEFVALVVNVNEGTLRTVAERCCALVESSGFQPNDDVVRVTVSIGAALARPDDTLETMVDRADELMYRSKKAGRNCVILESGP